ncbi:MAG: ATP-dependent DNA helicase RecG [Pseudomonadales bacterium]|nr:ATP-dependent DNA helicase RecG [Pseudomonadales bacterium]
MKKANPASTTVANKPAGPTGLHITRIKGIGPAIAEKLQRLGILSALDLLFHLPLRYEDRTHVQTIQELRNGQSAVIEGEITSNSVQFGKRRSLVCRLKDSSGVIDLRFFYFSAAQQKNLAVGTQLRCFGEVSLGRNGLTIIHPEYTTFDELAAQHPAMQDDQHLTAIYPSSDGLHQARWRAYMQAAFTLIKPGDLIDLVDVEQLNHAGLTTHHSLYDALKTLHFPPNTINTQLLYEGLHPDQRRLAFEELIAQRLSHMAVKNSQHAINAHPLRAESQYARRMIQQLPFSLTRAQEKVRREITSDLQRPIAMLRLLQGDVGSGKTVIAAFAALQAIANGMQAAIMAPTEILAEQHALAMTAWLEPLQINVALLVSKMPAPAKASVIQRAANGDIQLLIGTHALIQEEVHFNNLGLAIIDEQHRFGVEQRRLLSMKRDDGYAVHQLVMTATPIPRTLAMTFYADLEYSVIDELPPGRTPVQTVAIANNKREDVIERVKQACADGRQVYWVCTLVEESEVLQCQAAETTADELALCLPNVKVGLVHGRLKAEQKQQVMRAFKGTDLQLLVATTVIEVGVDVPNASLMIIENPERLGLAQLHQLRGRVGRGSVASHCVLLYQRPLSKRGQQRLDIMRQTNDGFVLAEQDLKMRGPGEVLGTRQSGAMSLRLADLERDSDLITPVVELADTISQRHPAKAAALVQRWCPDAEKFSRA